MKRIMRGLDRTMDIVLFLFFLLLFLVGAYTMYDTWLVYDHARDDSLLTYKPNPVTGEVEQPLSEDAVAWLTLDDTTIDDPVMQGESNEDYLNVDPYGNYSLSGSLFLDFRNAPDFTDAYSLIYGHHMDHGVMFGALDSFLDEEYFDTHRTGTLVVMGGEVYHYKTFACLEADGLTKEIFDPTEGYDTLEYVREHALIWREPEGERILALSTCKFPETTERIIVFGVLYQ